MEIVELTKGERGMRMRMRMRMRMTLSSYPVLPPASICKLNVVALLPLWTILDLAVLDKSHTNLLKKRRVGQTMRKGTRTHVTGQYKRF